MSLAINGILLKSPITRKHLIIGLKFLNKAAGVLVNSSLHCVLGLHFLGHYHKFASKSYPISKYHYSVCFLYMQLQTSLAFSYDAEYIFINMMLLIP